MASRASEREHMELGIRIYLQLRKFQNFLLKNQGYLCDPKTSFHDDIIIRLKQQLRENRENVNLFSWAISLYSLVLSALHGVRESSHLGDVD